MIVLNHYAGLLPQLFKQHIKGSEEKEELKKEVDALKCMSWLEDKSPIPDDWKRESRESVSYAR